MIIDGHAYCFPPLGDPIQVWPGWLTRYGRDGLDLPDALFEPFRASNATLELLLFNLEGALS
jgi:hypothetical protein